MKLRQGEPKDKSFISQAAYEFQKFGPYHEIIPRWFDDPWIKTYILEIERPVGFIMLGPMFNSFWQPYIDITAIFVAPEWQGKGLGTFMLKAAEKISRKEGYRYLRAHVGFENKKALALFKKANYVIKKKIDNYYPSGLGAYELRKDLRRKEEGNET
ncbi:GCN5-related N-acetyltransferase [Thermodesulfatator indicus DSM 15286]|uniref:GCN5-related N-acetyltransferase n=1 Tax=Thermodesulfatator indicus (strain DSM 15286 / JCM 11887 / CIR29812) TaxID=667014 RepID=F8A856_THEID|nr:GNAT family N-acetyltransferase [Thermodesulfatator indicus]AEH45055.1 GCN5-related N-acetyltransferase [Thermodesulfatator indicus DSM 15286]